jgi:hypothetical protein
MSAGPGDTSFFAFVPDVRRAGADAFCATLAEEIGVSGVTIAATYHASRDFRPRGGGPRVEYLPAGAHYFPPDETAYQSSPIKPWCPEPYGSPDLMAQLEQAARRRGLTVNAWTIFGFNERVGRLQPEFTQVNAYGDHYVTDLCPANPAVADYAQAVARDVMRYQPDRVLAESLHYHPLRAGREFLELGAWARLALGLCFCEHCARAAKAAGVDLDAVRSWATSVVDAAFAGEAGPTEQVLAPAAVDTVLDGQLSAFLSVRAGVVTRLTGLVSETVREAGGQLCFMDQAAAEKPLFDAGVVQEALRYGVDVAAIGSVCPGYQVLGYAPSGADVGRDVASYRAALGEDVAVRVALRPSLPDCATTANLTEKIDVAVAAGVSGIDFYHYGLVSSDALDRVRAALAVRVP